MGEARGCTRAARTFSCAPANTLFIPHDMSVSCVLTIRSALLYKNYRMLVHRTGDVLWWIFALCHSGTGSTDVCNLHPFTLTDWLQLKCHLKLTDAGELVVLSEKGSKETQVQKRFLAEFQRDFFTSSLHREPSRGILVRTSKMCPPSNGRQTNRKSHSSRKHFQSPP